MLLPLLLGHVDNVIRGVLVLSEFEDGWIRKDSLSNEHKWRQLL